MSSSWKFNQIQLESSIMNFNLYFNWNSNLLLNTCFILPFVLNTIYIIVMIFCYFKLNVIIFNMFFKKKTISTFVLTISPETQQKKRRSMRFLIAQCIWIFLGLAAYWVSECVAIILITQSPTNVRLVNNLSGIKWVIISLVNVFNSVNLLIFHHPTRKDFIQFFKPSNQL
ncbi:hypothetical protein CONCODRAFT_8338 [Conidiobolus coronatus NRRL 28638]|uniref:G-protein coupled receptors family 1 profile domain-containing protein n=1 Tax=Conidiobolus coronatus (strain ATCC 28846 / CBS 209.66 / NRRL 28638) TaxID=796925 RepID=A0A137P2L7_CONC2|nr:hypothetical protein CONCODRAFT_8338 [Conidiobolus coronatus NRRL 28638]|eukprot:KXN69273.1 hypothetical protein CONCODRAFT_8338 [Conidiobolus coronatus NRRL 28638]